MVNHMEHGFSENDSRPLPSTPWEKVLKQVCKPGSVPSSGDGHFSRTPIARRLQQPTRRSIANRTDSHPPERIAPCLVLLRVGFTEPAESPRLLVRSYRTVSPLPDPASPWRLDGPSAVCSLWHFPWPRGRSALPTTLSCGARTFLSPTSPAGGQSASDHPTCFKTSVHSTTIARSIRDAFHEDPLRLATERDARCPNGRPTSNCFR